MKLHSILCRYIVNTFKQYREYSLGECRWSLSGKKDDFICYLLPWLLKISPSEILQHVLFPTDKLTMLWTINKYTCLISETADSDKKKYLLCHSSGWRDSTETWGEQTSWQGRSWAAMHRWRRQPKSKRGTSSFETMKARKIAVAAVSVPGVRQGSSVQQ